MASFGSGSNFTATGELGGESDTFDNKASNLLESSILMVQRDKAYLLKYSYLGTSALLTLVVAYKGDERSWGLCLCSAEELELVWKKAF